MFAALEAAVDSGHRECASLLLAHGARSEAPPSPGRAKKEAKRAGESFHWDRQAGNQNWWVEGSLPMQTRKCRELDAQLTKHVLSAISDAKLLDSPLDRFAKVEKAHSAQFRKEAARRDETRARTLEVPCARG